VTLSIIIAIAAFLTLVAVVLLVRGLHPKSADLDALRARLQSIDIQAFRNLIDEREEKFLRQRLPSKEFHAVHRERMLAATEYVRCAARNAGILTQLAEAAKADPDPAVAAAAIKLQETAFQVRLNAYRALPRFYIRIVLPGLETVPQSLVEACDRLSRQAVILGCLRTPERAAVNRSL